MSPWATLNRCNWPLKDAWPSAPVSRLTSWPSWSEPPESPTSSQMPPIRPPLRLRNLVARGLSIELHLQEGVDHLLKPLDEDLRVPGRNVPVGGPWS